MEREIKKKFLMALGAMYGVILLVIIVFVAKNMFFTPQEPESTPGEVAVDSTDTTVNTNDSTTPDSTTTNAADTADTAVQDSTTTQENLDSTDSTNLTSPEAQGDLGVGKVQNAEESGKIEVVGVTDEIRAAYKAFSTPEFKSAAYTQIPILGYEEEITKIEWMSIGKGENALKSVGVIDVTFSDKSQVKLDVVGSPELSGFSFTQHEQG